MIYRFLIVLCCITSLNLVAQTNHASYDLLKYYESIENGSRTTSDLLLHAIVLGSNKAINDLEQNQIIQVKYSVNNMHAIKVREMDIPTLIEADGIQKVELHNIKVEPMDVLALRQMRVDSVHDGLGKLSTSYTGKDVVFGMIDSGIDPTNEEFNNEDSTSRILKFWDQNDASNSFSDYGYGKVYSKEEIDNGEADNYLDTTYNGHGTAVAAVAVGGGMIHDSVLGVAPEADIIAVGINPSVLDYTNRVPSLLQIVDGIHFIFSEAEKLGKPAVINISLGGLEGSHDAQDLPTQMIEGMLEQNGRALVVAAGNAGSVKHHIRFDLNNERKFSWFRPMYSNSDVCKRDSGMYMSFYMDSIDAVNVSYKVSMELTEPCCSQYGNTDYKPIINSYNNLEADNVALANGSRTVVKTYVEKIGKTYGLFIEAETSEEDYLIRVSFDGTGTIDGWSGALDERSCNSEFVKSKFTIGNSDEIENYDNYVKPDREQNISTAYTCSHKVITVGAFDVHPNFLDIDSVTRSYMLTPLVRSSFSSIGPTRDGRTKPDILGPGSRIITTNAKEALATKKESSRSSVYVSGEHVITDGTSFAAPAVAGVVALFFEKYPDAGYRDLLRLIHETALLDDGIEYPNNEEGYGRINAMGLLEYEGSVDVVELETKNEHFTVYPNPSYTSFTVDLNNLPSRLEAVQIFNSLGERIKFYSGTTKMVNVTNLSPGVYLIVAIPEKGMPITEKVLVTIRP
jgi:subtilisin family serine protease